MSLVPTDAFTMEDTLDGLSDAVPIGVMVSAFYLHLNLVSLNQWRKLFAFARGTPH